MNNIREMRIAKGLTQHDLAMRLRKADPTVNQARVSWLEKGDVYAGEKLMKALSEALECPEESIYTGVETAFVPAADIVRSETTEALARILMFGAENAIKRAALIAMTGWPDRELRRNIEKARVEGLVIANDQNGKGYYRPNKREEFERLHRQNKSRALAILKQQKHIGREMNEC